MFPSALPEQAVIGCCMKFDISALFVRDEFAPLCTKLQGVKVVPASSIADSPAPVAKVDPESPAAIFFTGGTTGAPKGAVLSHRALMRGCFNAIFKPGKVIGVHRYIALLPLSHVFGLIAGTMGCFYTGNLIHTCEDMKATIGKLPAIRPTILIIVPGICDILAGLCKMYGPQFLGGQLRMIISGAANVPPRLVDIFTKLGVEFCFGYGLTESANLTSANADAIEKPTSIGRVYPGQEIQIVDGELWLKGDNIFSGYYKDPENTKVSGAASVKRRAEASFSKEIFLSPSAAFRGSSKFNLPGKEQSARKASASFSPPSWSMSAFSASSPPILPRASMAAFAGLPPFAATSARKAFWLATLLSPSQ